MFTYIYIYIYIIVSISINFDLTVFRTLIRPCFQYPYQGCLGQNKQNINKRLFYFNNMNVWEGIFRRVGSLTSLFDFLVCSLESQNNVHWVNPKYFILLRVMGLLGRVK